MDRKRISVFMCCVCLRNVQYNLADAHGKGIPRSWFWTETIVPCNRCRKI